MRLKIFLNILVLTALCTFSTGFARADIIATIDEFNGVPDFDFNVGPPDYPLPPVTIGNFTFTIPTGETVIGGTITGTFGNNDISAITAASDYFIDNGNIKVAACDDASTFNDVCDSFSANTSLTPTSWSYTLTSNDLSNLATELQNGSIDFSVVQNFAVAVETGTTTLDLVVTPEPSMIFLLYGGLAGIVLLRRHRKA